MVWVPPEVSSCDLARNYNGLGAVQGESARFSKELQWFGSPRRDPFLFEQGITIVWRTVRSVLCDLARNYTGFGALAGIHVHLSIELHWFGEL